MFKSVLRWRAHVRPSFAAPFALVPLAFVLLSGCAGTDGSEDARPLPGRLGPVENVTLFLTADGGLSYTVPEAGSVGVSFPLTAMLLGTEAVAFDLQLPAALRVLPGNATFSAFLRSDAPQASNGAFDVGVWLGTPDSSAAMGIGLGAQSVLPGEVQQVEVPIQVGATGFAVAEGSALRLLVASGFGASPSMVELQVGGDNPSHLHLQVANYTEALLPAGLLAAEKTLAGRVQGGSQLGCDPVPGTTSHQHEVPVPADASLLELRLAASHLQPHVDLDLHLADGDVPLGLSARPSAEEAIVLAAEALDGLRGRTLTATVASCGPGPADYTLLVRTA